MKEIAYSPRQKVSRSLYEQAQTYAIHSLHALQGLLNQGNDKLASITFPHELIEALANSKTPDQVYHVICSWLQGDMIDPIPPYFFRNGK